MAKKRGSAGPPSVEACEHAVAMLRQADEPLDAKALAKLLQEPHRISAGDLAPVLEAFVDGGMLIRYPGKTAKGQPRYWDRDAGAIARQAALLLLQTADEPLTAKDVAAKLSTPLKFSEKELARILEECTTAGLIHAIPPKAAKGKPRFWSQDILEFGRRRTLETLKLKGPLPPAKLQTALKEIDNGQFDRVLRSLEERGAVFRHPPRKTGPDLIGNRPPAPEDYLKDVQTQLTKVVKTLRGANVPFDALRRAVVQLVEAAGIPFGGAPTSPAPAKSAAVDLISLMQRLEPGAERGTLVGARDLRRAAGMPKSQFDELVLQLARDGRLSLHRHDYPASLSAAERDELVADAHDQFYVGIALRRPPGQV